MDLCPLGSNRTGNLCMPDKGALMPRCMLFLTFISFVLFNRIVIYLQLKADRPHPRDYPHTPTDFRHTDKHLRLVMKFFTSKLGLVWFGPTLLFIWIKSDQFYYSLHLRYYSLDPCLFMPWSVSAHHRSVFGQVEIVSWGWPVLPVGGANFTLLANIVQAIYNSPAAHGGRPLPVGWVYWLQCMQYTWRGTKIQAPRSIGCGRRACHIRKEGRKEGKLGNI